MEEKLEEKAKRIQEEITDFLKEIEKMEHATDQIQRKIRNLLIDWNRIGENVMELELKIHEAKKLMQKLSKEE